MHRHELEKRTGCGAMHWVRLGYGLIGQGLSLAVALFLAVMAVAICYQVFSRYLFNAPSVVTEEILRFSLIWMGFLAAGLCFMRGQHLSLTLLLDLLPRRAARWLEGLNACLILVFGLILIWGGWQSFFNNAFMKTPILQVPVGSLQLVILICGALMLVSQVAIIAERLRDGETSMRPCSRPWRSSL